MSMVLLCLWLLFTSTDEYGTAEEKQFSTCYKFSAIEDASCGSKYDVENEKILISKRATGFPVVSLLEKI